MKPFRPYSQHRRPALWYRVRTPLFAGALALALIALGVVLGRLG